MVPPVKLSGLQSITPLKTENKVVITLQQPQAIHEPVQHIKDAESQLSSMTSVEMEQQVVESNMMAAIGQNIK